MKTERITSLLAALALACVHSPATHAGTAPIVTTESGPIIGPLRNGVYEYRGIPYAAPPVGNLRWSAPQPPASWTEVRAADAFGPACAQQRRFDLTEASESEDCLTLNVSVPRSAKPQGRLPVLVWIHGGAFVGGSSRLYRLDKLAREGNLVVVSINYRLGVFGFMPHPAFDAATNGNLGLEDQRYALAWVKRNIAAFGGDPDNVTVGGESAGAGSTCMHLASPEKTKGLFNKAIVMSAGCLQQLPTLQEATQSQDATWRKIAKDVNCPTDGTAGSAASLACLRSKPVSALLEAQGRASGGIMSFSPTVDSPTVPRSPAAAARNRQLLPVPVMMGGARDELRLYVAYSVLFPPNLRSFDEKTLRAAWLPSFYGADTKTHDAIIAEYVKGKSIDGAAFGSMISDFNPHVGINNCLYLRTADLFAPLLPSLHQFEFTDPNAPVLGVGIAKGMNPGFALGAVHSSALNYWFPRLSNTSAIDAPALAPASQKLADRMVKQWAAFARTGSPAGAGLPAWPRYAGGATVMQLDPVRSAPYDAARHHRCGFWDTVYPRDGGTSR